MYMIESLGPLPLLRPLCSLVSYIRGLEEVRGWTPSSDKISVHCAWWGYRMRVFLIFDFFVRVSSDWCAGLKLDPTTYDEGPG